MAVLRLAEDLRVAFLAAVLDFRCGRFLAAAFFLELSLIHILPSHKSQWYKRQKLRQAHEPKVERVMPERVHLPANRHGLHLYRESCEKSGGEKPSEPRMT